MFVSETGRRNGWYILAGIFLGVGFVAPIFWWGGVVGVGVFLFAALRDQSMMSAVLGGLYAWTVKSLIVLVWFFSTYPLDWLPFEFGHSAWFFIAVFWIYSAAVLGLGGAVFGLIFQQVKKRIAARVAVLLLPGLWVVCEVLGSLFFSVFTYGPGGNFGTTFSFGYVGYVLAGKSLFGWAATLGGVYALSFLAATLGVFSWWLGVTKRPGQVRFGVALLSILVLVALSVIVSPHVKTAENETKIAVVETEFSAVMMRDPNWSAHRSEKLEEAVRAALLHNPDYLLLPEDARFLVVPGTPQNSYNHFRFLFADPSVVLVDTRMIAGEQNDTILRSYVYDGIAKQGLAVDKQLLVPNGEFLPKFTSLVVGVVAGGDRLEELRTLLTYRPGPFISQAGFPSYVPGVLFCFESANPIAAKQLVSERSVPFIAHPVSHAMFHAPRVLTQQLDAMLRVQALWSGVPIVSASNQSRSALYEVDGSMVYPTSVESGEGWRVGVFVR